MPRLLAIAGLIATMLAVCCGRRESPGSATAAAAADPDVKQALEGITSDGLLKHVRVLSANEFEGRAPGSRGEELTVRYLTEQFQKMGLKPGNPDGTYLQKVPLVGFTGAPTFSFFAGGKRTSPRFPDEYVAVSRRFVPEVKVADSDMIFVGYGVVAPEYQWDDYKGLDVRGKTIVMLINDPAVPDQRDPSRLDERMFRGKAMTYYGRWTYKYEIASEKGAAAAIIVHETGPAGYPYEVVSGSWGRENFDIQKPDKNMNRVAVESWVSLETAKKLFAAGGHNFDDLKKAALQRDFRPVPLGVKASFTLRNAMREIQSNNVLARLEGTDPKLKNEHVVYSAHWDHLGKNSKLQDDQIFNGALDNASGTATVLELAAAFARLKAPPKRSVLFLCLTAEEQGLLGAKYYAENPLYPLAGTAANINIDGVNQWGRTRDLVLVGLGNSTLDDVAAEAAGVQGRVIKSDPEPEKGFFYRSDHFEFAKQGVPALDPDSGTDYIGKPGGYGQQKRDEYTAKDYHKVSDEIKPDWDLTGAVDDARLFFLVGYRVAQDPKLPEWKPGTEFKAKREAMLVR